MASKITLYNQIELPPIDDFRLETILSKVVQGEKKQLSNTILNVKNQFQADLRQELRHSLSREQRIQYKNIAVVKKADLVREKMKSHKKRWAKLGAGGPTELPNAVPLLGTAAPEKPDTLLSEVGSLHQVAGSISEGVVSLAARLSALDVCMGGSGLPDREKYPMIHQMLTQKKTQGQNTTTATQNGAVQQDNDLEDESPKPEDTPADKAPADSDPPGDSDASDEINSEIFENLINEYNRKSRLKRERRKEKVESDKTSADSVESRPESSIESRLATRPGNTRPRNPLRLLSLCGSMRSDMSIRSETSNQSLETALPERMETRFLPAKSMATVGESPELTLHKKLRINALPLSSKRGQACKCTKQEKGDADDHLDMAKYGGGDGDKDENENGNRAEKQNGDMESAKKCLTKFLTNYDSQFGDVTASSSFDLDFDSSGINSDTDSVHSSASSNSSESFLGNIGDTNEYYDSLRRDIRKRYRNRKSTRSLKESSPNPKHQPSHRTLQPKQSILKLQRKRCEHNDSYNNTSRNNSVKIQEDVGDVSVDHDMMEDLKDTKDVDSLNDNLKDKAFSEFTVSPRASFVMENSGAGEILRHGSDEGSDPEPEAISKLRSLLL